MKQDERVGDGEGGVQSRVEQSAGKEVQVPIESRMEDGRWKEGRRAKCDGHQNAPDTVYKPFPTLSYSFLSDPAALMSICSISGSMHGDGAGVSKV
jgi:hypothetical protein